MARTTDFVAATAAAPLSRNSASACRRRVARVALAVSLCAAVPVDARTPVCASRDAPAADGESCPTQVKGSQPASRVWDTNKGVALLQFRSIYSAAKVQREESTPLKNRHGLCLDAAQPGVNGGNLHMWTCFANYGAQEWFYEPGTGLIRNSQGACLDAAERNTNGGKVHLWECNGANLNQQWSYDPISGMLRSRHGKCLDAAQRSTDGGLVHMWDCQSANPNQQWNFDAAGAGDGSGCRTALEGESCYKDVRWAMTYGIQGNPDWYPGLSQSSTFESFQAYFFEQGINKGVCPSMPCALSCRTLLPGDGCYVDVQWARDVGIWQHPDWYPGLSPTSSFEAFQHFLHDERPRDCARPCDGYPLLSPEQPAESTTAAAESTTAAAEKDSPTAAPARELEDESACNAVWDTPAVDMWDANSRYTCGQRISWFQSPNGGSLAPIDAKAKIALDFSADCSPCWPWKKYRGAADGLSSKRGIAIQNKQLSAASLDSLRSAVTWSYGWSSQVEAPEGSPAPTASEWSSSGVDWLPMIWGTDDVYAAENMVSALDWSPRGDSHVLLGFNEPNFEDQAHQTPEEAAALWPRLEELARVKGIEKLVSPAVNFHHINDGIQWLHDFFAVCTGCKVDAIAFHTYTCHGRFLRDHLDLYRVFGKPMWVTEFACAEGGDINKDRLSMDGQMAYMREAIPLLEADPDVETYAWFSYFGDEWSHPVGGVTGDAGLVYKDGGLSPLGQLYGSFK